MAIVVNTIDEYISQCPENIQLILSQIRELIKKTVPDAEEAISYGIPTFKLNGRNLIHFAGYKKHIGMYPAPREHVAFKDTLKSYKGGKGTVQFSLNQPLPIELIIEIVKYRVAKNQED
ncbi:iron chaperone [Solitalea lacus]|uniref:iron chaperone n=1 Tax=Solitalea lacus TaxID=2911172 RepID=UPI001EDB04CC|nr:DUF1801 domain-containing protein [Solitalea lacus]UKJ06091.1 DUF1801 domain-containing protein [Solitalea lacus]